MTSLTGWAASFFAIGMTCAIASQAKTVILTPTDNRTQVSLNLGDTLTVELPTGDVPNFRWVSHLTTPSALTALNDSTEPAANGRPSLRQFRFNAAVAGDVILAFGFETPIKIPGAAPQDASAFSVQVNVASGAPSAGTTVLFGLYKGTMPCADCSGLDTTLSLYAKSMHDTTYAFYVRTQTYRGAPHGDLTFSDRGEWFISRGDAIDPNATVYQLNPDSQQSAESLLVKDNGATLLQLDRNQKPIDTPMNMTLRRVAP
jgi:predicted secreted protein